jgi:serine O-acetyltransferase
MDSKRSLSQIVDSIMDSYERHGELSHLESRSLPSRDVVWGIVEDLLCLLFPGFLETAGPSAEEFAAYTALRVHSISRRLETEIHKGLCLREHSVAESGARRTQAVKLTLALMEQVPTVRDHISEDIQAAYEGDPAAKSFEEIILSYPGLQAIAVYRLAHVLYLEEVPVIPRVMTEYSHSRTGIDIHPGARIGRRFFIDHGTGVVIGETCTIGDDVKIYQGVTLGAKSFPRDEDGRVIKGVKRHPDLEDNVTIYSGATILGDVRLGAGSVVGGNVWLTRSIPPDTKIMVRPPQQIHVDNGVPDYQI